MMIKVCEMKAQGLGATENESPRRLVDVILAPVGNLPVLPGERFLCLLAPSGKPSAWSTGAQIGSGVATDKFVTRSFGGRVLFSGLRAVDSRLVRGRVPAPASGYKPKSQREAGAVM
jgi:hypothetical protein